MIRDLEVTVDGAGFPVLSWRELRGAHSPECGAMAKVECRIMKEAESGVLLFVVRGSARQGDFERGKPWQLLKSFPVRPAQELYWSAAQKARFDHLLQRIKHSRSYVQDTAQVVLAEFAGGHPLHLNCAEASHVDLAELELALNEHFIRRRKALVSASGYVSDLNDARIMTYDTHRSEGVTQSVHWSRQALFLDAVALLAFWCVLGLFIWLVVRT